MIDIVGEKCCGCYACYNSCPKACITMQENEEGFYFPVIDETSCISCNLCEKVCPIINTPSVYKLQKSYAAYNKEIEIREKSSSGGIYSLLAKKKLDKNGIVYGVAFAEDFQSVHHIRIENYEDLHKTYTSKYMQSHVDDIFEWVKKDLNQGMEVLFSGTPCQVAGLRNYLGRDYRNLLCVDFICHGVPSEKIWRIYTNRIVRKFEHKIDNVNFRCKDKKGWNSLLELELDSKCIKENQKENLYYKAFLNDLCLRKSCYDCRFKSVNGFSDITLADFWGIEYVCSEMNDGMGTSLVLVNSDKGDNWFKEIRQEVILKEVDYRKSISFNPARIRSADKNFSRNKYFSFVNEENFEELTNKCSKNSTLKKAYKFYLRVCRKIKRVIHKDL